MLKKSLQLCAEIESMIGQIYRNFEQSSASTPKMKAFWAQMALDETDHERQIRFVLRLPTKEICLNKEGEEDRRVATLHGQVRAALTRVEQEMLTANKMLDLAEQLESHFMTVHAANAVASQHKSLKNMLTALGKHDQEHIAQLTEFIKDFRSTQPS
ncbi:MAG: hypothetical protein P1P74_02040 [Desulfuromonadales bacterium]|nr:hypothetical protein [Desulfuromonadales bacterium]